MRIVRLGQDVDRTGRLADEALARVFAAIDEYAEIIAAHDVEALRFCATSAARDAENAAEFAAGVESRLGVVPEVVTGAEEAQLSYDGATRGLVDRGLPGPVLVVDIGGGSTELILGDGHGHVRTSQSLDIGSVRMTERHLRSDPPTRAEIAEAVGDVASSLDRTVVPSPRRAPWSASRGRSRPSPRGCSACRSTTGPRSTRPCSRSRTCTPTTASLLAMTVAERRAQGYMHPGRADVIGAGALILDEVLRRTTARTLLVSEADILDGIAWSLTTR